MKQPLFIKWTLLFTFCSLLAQAENQPLSEVVDMIREGKIDEARMQLNTIKSKDKPSDSLLFLLGLLSTHGDSASFYYEQLLKTYPKSTYSDDALLRLAQIKYALGLYKAALIRYNSLISTYPNSPLISNCHYGAGLCFIAMGQSDSASIRFQKVIQGYPESEITDLARLELTDLDHQESPDSQTPPSSETQPTQDQMETDNNKTLRYAIQVGAFTHQQNALVRKTFFEKEGYHVNLRTKSKDDQIFYLVWIGSFDNRGDTEKFKEKLMKKYGGKYTLVYEEVP